MFPQTSSNIVSEKASPSQSSKTGNRFSQQPRQSCKLDPVCDHENLVAYRRNNSEGKTSVKQLAAESAEKAKQKN